MKILSTPAFFTVLAASVTFSGVSFATPTYPSALQSELDLDRAPPCVTCHDNPGGGTGTATEPFAESLRDRGLVGGTNIASLEDALEELTEDAVDSDGDDVVDIDELLAGSDPNDEDDVPSDADDESADDESADDESADDESDDEPSGDAGTGDDDDEEDDGGCSVSAVPASSGSPWAFIGLAVGALAFARRRRNNKA